MKEPERHNSQLSDADQKETVDFEDSDIDSTEQQMQTSFICKFLTKKTVECGDLQLRPISFLEQSG